jgi:hypothetical protein
MFHRTPFSFFFLSTFLSFYLSIFLSFSFSFVCFAGTASTAHLTHENWCAQGSGFGSVASWTDPPLHRPTPLSRSISNLEYFLESIPWTSWKSALSIRDLGDPFVCSQCLKSFKASIRPSASPETLPSGSLRTTPKIPSSTAFCCVNLRKYTPCTLPRITKAVLINIGGLLGER